jgi:hypothetical protein
VSERKSASSNKNTAGKLSNLGKSVKSSKGSSSKNMNNLGKYGKSSKDCDKCDMFVLLLFRPKVVLCSMKRALLLRTLRVTMM